ncbi:MAG: porin, partial [Candidatus Adiutrix sp.]
MKKKALAMALGAMIAAGGASQAAAASMVDFKGSYYTFYVVDSNLGHEANDTLTDSYFGHRLQLDIDFVPTDEISVHWRLRGPWFQRWGSQDGQNIETKHVYGQIKQDWGTVYVGRLADSFDSYGLGSLGYGQDLNWYAYASPFDFDADNLDAIRYEHAWDNGFGLMAQFSRLKTMTG